MTLVVMAAGRGSRFGGMKQVAGIGPSGEALFDYAVYDAVRCGFEDVVFVVSEASVDAVEAHVEAGPRRPGHGRRATRTRGRYGGAEGAAAQGLRPAPRAPRVLCFSEEREQEQDRHERAQRGHAVGTCPGRWSCAGAFVAKPRQAGSAATRLRRPAPHAGSRVRKR